jgi:hypothetical protein
MCVALVQYPHLVLCVVASPNAIFSSIVPNFALQKVPPPVQDEHGDVVEDSGWAHKMVL